MAVTEQKDVDCIEIDEFADRLHRLAKSRGIDIDAYLERGIPGFWSLIMEILTHVTVDTLEELSEDSLAHPEFRRLAMEEWKHRRGGVVGA